MSRCAGLLVVAVMATTQARADAPATGGATALADAPEVPEASRETDHARVVGHVGVGWFGVSEIPLGDVDTVLAAPAIGVRWWFSERVGVDLGAGVAVAVRDVSATQQGGAPRTVSGPTLGFLLHLGVPLALYDGQHYTLTVVPEVNIGVASAESTTTQEDLPAPQTSKSSGSRIDAGARIGAEIHFGFVGLPELALEASVGLFFSRRAASATTDGTERSVSVIELSTTSFNDPWDFFRSAVAARYYF